MNVREANEKRKTCKLCLKKPGYSFCKRHSPKMTVTVGKIKYSNTLELDEREISIIQNLISEKIKKVDEERFYGREPLPEGFYIEKLRELIELQNKFSSKPAVKSNPKFF